MGKKYNKELLDKLKGSIIINADASGIPEPVVSTKCPSDFGNEDFEKYATKHILVYNNSGNSNTNSMEIAPMLVEVVGMSKTQALNVIKHIHNNGSGIIAIGCKKDLIFMLDKIIVYMSDTMNGIEIKKFSEYETENINSGNSNVVGNEDFNEIEENSWDSRPKDHRLIFLKGGVGENDDENGYEDMVILLDRIVGYNSDLKARQYTEVIYNDCDASVFYGTKNEVEAMQGRAVRFMELMGFTEFGDKCKIEKVKKEPEPLRFLDSDLVATVKQGNAVKLVTSKKLSDNYYRETMDTYMGYRYLMEMLDIGVELSVLYITGYISNTDTYIITNPSNGKVVYGHDAEFLFLPTT